MAERYMTPKQVENFARSYTWVAFKTLITLAQHAKSESVRRAAANDLLDRAWGRPTQRLDLNDERDHDMKRIIFESYSGALEQLESPVMIEPVEEKNEETQEDILGMTIRRRPKLLDRGKD